MKYLSDIRVTYSGLIALVVGLTSVLTGIIFTLIVTRRLSQEEFGIWAVIGNMISYFLIAEPVISYWSTRQIARGEEVGKTSIISSLIFSIGSVPAYVILGLFVFQVSNSNPIPMILGGLLLPVTFVSQTLSGINLGHKPHATSYSLLTFEFLKIPVGLIAVYFLDLGVVGAIIATLIAYLGKIAIQLYFARVKLKNKFRMKVLIHWIKLSWIQLYSNLSHLIWTLDIILYATIIGSTIGIAYYSVSLAISAIIGHAGLISQALYPKLIAKGNLNYIQENFTHLMFFGIPLLGIGIIFSKPALFALNPSYMNASLIVIFISIRTFFYMITGVFYQVLMGIENVDVTNNIKYSNLAKSYLFRIPTLSNLHSGLYATLLAIIFFVFKSYNLSEIDIVLTWAMIMMSLQIPFFIYSWRLVQKHSKFSFPFNNTIKYVTGTLIFAAIFFISADSIINYQTSIFVYLPSLLSELFLCIAAYISFTFLVDSRTRILIKSIISEIIKK